MSIRTLPTPFFRPFSHPFFSFVVLVSYVLAPSLFAQKAEKQIARVLQQTITASQLEPDDKIKAQAKAELKKDYPKWLTQIRYVKLASMVWEPLQQKFMKEKGITVAPSEVTSFFEYAKKARELQKGQFQQALQKLNADMAAGKVPPAQKAEADAMKKNLQNALEQLGKPLPEPSAQEKEFASRTIQVWKFDQALYKQFGGAVVMKQSNPMEPIGAYKKYLEDREKAKNFEVIDAEYKKNFWQMFDVPKQAPVVPPNKVDYSKPWWVLMVEAGQKK
ncbi:MAG: hypothetical protein EAZ92_08655 [Candidatus Kapaibacterium sp.]|nr:MAG: hypothetical protein EAZ92_08655 [Candidatus Kapabacteria bacterium]